MESNKRIAGWHENENVIAAHRSDKKRSTVSEWVIHKPTGICTTMYASRSPLVLVTPKSTNTQSKYTKGTLGIPTMATQQQLTQVDSPTSTYSLADFLVRLSQSLASVKDLTTPEEHSFLTSLGFLQKKDPDIWYSKTSKVYLVTTVAKLSRQYLGFSPTWGIELNGKYLTAKTSEFPKTENVSTLSDILEKNVAEKYYLSPAQTEKILSSSTNPNTVTTGSTVRGGVSPTLNTMQGGNRQPFIINPKMNNYKPNDISVSITASSYKEPPVVLSSLSELRERKPDSLGRNMPVHRTHRSGIRRLTPLECERLQGFPDNWTEGESDTQRYKMCGNAVTVNVVEAVMTNLIKHMEQI